MLEWRVALWRNLVTDLHVDYGTCFYFVGSEREERSRSGAGGEDRQRGSTCQWHSELETRSSLMAFCLSGPHHAGVAAPARPPSCSAALHTALCLGGEMPQMFASLNLSTSVSRLACLLILWGAIGAFTDGFFLKSASRGFSAQKTWRI